MASTICLGNISKDWSADNMKITGLNEYVYEFNVDYRAFNSPNFDKATLGIHKYFMVKYGKYKMFQLIKKVFFISDHHSYQV